MAQVSTLLKRHFLRAINDSRDDEHGTSLLELLKSATKATYSVQPTGLVLTAVAGNGHQSTWTVTGDLTPSTVAELVSELRDRYEEAVAELGGGATDDQIFSEMMEFLKPVRSVEQDWSGLRSSRESEQ